LAGEDLQNGLMRRSTDLFLSVEHAIHIALGALLSVAALIALAGSVAILWNGLPDWQGGEALLTLMDRLLFVLMLAEILHTVRVSIRSGTLNGEPFLIVGLIASIRRVLVITLESSQANQGKGVSDQGLFQSSMIELGVLAVMILVMVVSIYILRQASAIEPEHIPGSDMDA
jgi:hypothetical protein